MLGIVIDATAKQRSKENPMPRSVWGTCGRGVGLGAGFEGQSSNRGQMAKGVSQSDYRLISTSIWNDICTFIKTTAAASAVGPSAHIRLVLSASPGSFNNNKYLPSLSLVTDRKSINPVVFPKCMKITLYLLDNPAKFALSVTIVSPTKVDEEEEHGICLLVTEHLAFHALLASLQGPVFSRLPLVYEAELHCSFLHLDGSPTPCPHPLPSFCWPPTSSPHGRDQGGGEICG